MSIRPRAASAALPATLPSALIVALSSGLALALATLFVLAPATDAKKSKSKRDKQVTPRTGIYSAEPVKPTGDFLLGTFAVVRDRDGTRIVSVETKKGIYYPSLMECDRTVLPLRKEVVPVKASGRFKVRDVRPTLQGRQIVRWSGRWVRPGKVRGEVRIKVKHCKSSYPWKARRLPPGSE